MSQELARARWTEAFFRESRKTKDSYLSLLCDDVLRLIEEYSHHLLVRTDDEEYHLYRGRTHGRFRVRWYSHSNGKADGYIEGTCKDGIVIGDCFRISGKEERTSLFDDIAGSGWSTVAFVARGFFGTSNAIRLDNCAIYQVFFHIWGKIIGTCTASRDGSVYWCGRTLAMNIGEIYERAKHGEWLELVESDGVPRVEMGFGLLDKIWNGVHNKPAEER